MENHEEEQKQLEAKLRADRLEKMIDRRESVSTETAKAAILLNSGALVSMLGFMQALAGKAHLSAFKGLGIAAMCAFLFGCTAATMSIFVRHWYLANLHHKRDTKPSGKLFLFSMILAVMAFVIGVGLVIFGIAIAF